jgi:hypothetical protein
MNLQEIASASAMLKQELAPLADRIGQGAEYTFSLFVKQVYVNAFSNLLWIVPGTIVLTFVKPLWKKAREIEKQDYGSADSLWPYFGSALCLICGLIMILSPISELIGALINPEFQAIQLIIQTFRTVK